jgi:hypothetical protein
LGVHLKDLVSLHAALPDTLAGKGTEWEEEKGRKVKSRLNKIVA